MFSKKEEPRTPYTIVQCQSCKKESKRKFNDGDYLFKDSAKCNYCDGHTIIVKIFGEAIKEQ